MNVKELYINYFKSKAHVEIPSAPLIPENDPSVLFNTAGMQPLVPYLMGEKHPCGKRLVNAQKCMRTKDLEEVGDKTHHTFFEMLGNWSLGDYFKKESLTWSIDFLTNVLNIPLTHLAATAFSGNEFIAKDIESISILRGLGINKIKETATDNFWIAGDVGPCGPDCEIFYWRSPKPVPKYFDPEDDNWVEIWNNVFMQYYKDDKQNITQLAQKNVDTGMGLERICAIVENKEDNYESSLWTDIIKMIETVSKLSYKSHEFSMRIIADHLRSAVFILADNSLIKPSNTDQGYILRRLIRRAIRHAKKLNIDINSNWEEQIACVIIKQYEDYYPELKTHKQIVLDTLKNEKLKFNKTLEKGLKEFAKYTNNLDDFVINKDIAFKLYDTYGFPIELTIEEAKNLNMKVDIDGFYEKFKQHQELSRANSKEKFKGGLASTGQMETKYHTATHLLNAALKKVIGNDVHQRGSNITAKRMRFDFSCNHKLSDEEKQQVEQLVNEWIKQDLVVKKVQMSKEAAIKSGAECMFIEKYPDIVSVYYIGEVSKELCGGPHVEHTNVLGTFKIIKEEASSSGVRRIKAILI